MGFGLAKNLIWLPRGYRKNVSIFGPDSLTVSDFSGWNLIQKKIETLYIVHTEMIKISGTLRITSSIDLGTRNKKKWDFFPSFKCVLNKIGLI